MAQFSDKYGVLPGEPTADTYGTRPTIQALP